MMTSALFPKSTAGASGGNTVAICEGTEREYFKASSLGQNKTGVILSSRIRHPSVSTLPTQWARVSFWG